MSFKSLTPSLLVSLTSLVLLTLVTLNTPIIKSLNFLKASYTDGAIQGTVTFGTLGYCYDYTFGTGSTAGGRNCTGPTVGYQFDLNTIFGLDDRIKIPTAISKYLTYVLVLHIVAVVASATTLLLKLLDLIPSFSLLCFPSLLAWLTSASTLLAFIIDLILFYIARARINSVSGAHAEIGICVWLMLAAWVLTAIAGVLGCIGGCVSEGEKRGQRRGRRDREDYERVGGMAGQSDALDQGEGKKFGPPLREREISIPLNANARSSPEHKYLQDDEEEEEERIVPGVGYGSGPRRQPSSNSYNDPHRYPPQNPGGYEYDSQMNARAGTGYVPNDTGYAQGAGMAGAGAYGAGGAGAYGYTHAHGLGGNEPYGQERYEPAVQGRGQGYGYDQYGDPYHGQQGYPSPPPQQDYTSPPPQPIAMPVPSASSPPHQIDPYSNPQPLTHPTLPPPTDAYGGYETPNTAHPDYAHPADHQQQHHPQHQYGIQAGISPIAPVPRGLTSNMPNGGPGFSLDSVSSPTAPSRALDGFDTADLAGPGPPAYYHSGAEAMNQAGQAGQVGQAGQAGQGQSGTRRSMDKTGYFR